MKISLKLKFVFFTGKERKFLELRPGIIGLSCEMQSKFHQEPASMKYSNVEEILAQQPDPVKYNDEVIWPDKVRLNLEYVNRRNFWIDLKLIIYTVLGKKLEDW